MFYVVKWCNLRAVFLHCNPKEFILGEKYQTCLLKYLKYTNWFFCNIFIIIVETLIFRRGFCFLLAHLQYF